MDHSAIIRALQAQITIILKMKILLHYWPMLLSGTALAASDPARVDETGILPHLKARETIVVKGQRVEQKLSDISGAITVITEEDLDRQVATELTDVFKNEPGVSVTGSAGRPQNISIRGIGGNRVLIIKDGGQGQRRLRCRRSQRQGGPFQLRSG